MEEMSLRRIDPHKLRKDLYCSSLSLFFRFVDMFAVGKLDIFALQNRYNSVSQNFDMLPNGNKFDINSHAR